MIIRIIIWSVWPGSNDRKIEHIYEGTREQLLRADGSFRSKLQREINKALAADHYVTIQKQEYS